MVIRIITLISFLQLFLMINVSRGDLVVNEVMSNEPGSDKDLEWVEIYNNSTSPKNMAFYRFFIFRNQNIDTLLTDISIPAGEFVVFIVNTAAYDSVWGNNSGVWGDDDSLEHYYTHELPGLSLINDSGKVYLVDYLLTTTISAFEWYEDGGDGVSWERIHPDSAIIRQSIDRTGSTPGRLNSWAPQNYDLGLASVRVWPDLYNETGFDILVVNFGMNPMPETTLTIYYDPEQDTAVTENELIAYAYIPETDPGDSLTFTGYFALDGYYPYILIRLPDDDQPLNNYWLNRVYGREHPSVVISEFLPDPKSPLEVEWVELKNRSDIDFNLQHWQLGDEKTFHPITNDELILRPGEYLVLCKDSAGLADYYVDNTIPILELSSWAILNNDEDIVRLRDHYGIVVDSIVYNRVYGGNRSWARGEEYDTQDRWGWSVDAGGTPGDSNEIHLEPAGTSLELHVTPNPFSPTIDGEMIIEFSVPPGDNITLKIYDLEGRIVKTLLNNLSPYDGTVTWPGIGDNGRRLKVGMYVLYMEVSGVEQYKQTIVIAP